MRHHRGELDAQTGAIGLAMKVDTGNREKHAGSFIQKIMPRGTPWLA